MSRPFHRGVSGGGRYRVTVLIHLDDSQVKDKQRGMISIIIAHLVIRLLSIFFFQIILSPNIISVRMDFYLIHLIPETARSRHKLAFTFAQVEFGCHSSSYSCWILLVDDINSIFIKSSKNPWNLEASGASIGFKGCRTALSRISDTVLLSRTLFHVSENLGLGLSGGDHN